MSRQLAIRYRDFWDVPRIFFAEFDGALYLFDCAFDEVAEDYPEYYSVFLMPHFSESDYAERWTYHWQRALRKLGIVPISKVRFDATMRRSIDSGILEEMTQNPTIVPSNGMVHATTHQPIG